MIRCCQKLVCSGVHFVYPPVRKIDISNSSPLIFRCTINVHCGIPAANCNQVRKLTFLLSDFMCPCFLPHLLRFELYSPTCVINVQLRDRCISMSGSCENGHCVCATEYYGCGNCHAKSTLVRRYSSNS